MALIQCEECGKKVSNKASTCPNCGCPISEQTENVLISFPIWQGQLAFNNCYVFDEDRNEIAKCKQGETISIECSEPMNITVKMQNAFGKPSITIKPGKKYKVDFRGFGKVYIKEVDKIV